MAEKVRSIKISLQEESALAKVQAKYSKKSAKSPELASGSRSKERGKQVAMESRPQATSRVQFVKTASLLNEGGFNVKSHHQASRVKTQQVKRDPETPKTTNS